MDSLRSENVFAAPIDPKVGMTPHAYWEQVLSKRYGSRPPLPSMTTQDGSSTGARHIRFVCISDTHEKLEELIPHIPNGDILIHAGDFTQYGDRDEIKKFNEQIGSLPHRYKVVVAGNHELGFEVGCVGVKQEFLLHLSPLVVVMVGVKDEEDLSQRTDKYRGRGTPKGYELLTNCIYLHNSLVELYGVKIYGTPYHPLPGFSFYRAPGEAIRREWEKIPTGGAVDVLVTHTPPLGHLDVWTGNGEHQGCADLLECVEERVRPKFHIFGHLHEQNGLSTNSNETTTFINASICDHALNVINRPIVFDYELPDCKEKKA